MMSYIIGLFYDRLINETLSYFKIHLCINRQMKIKFYVEAANKVVD